MMFARKLALLGGVFAVSPALHAADPPRTEVVESTTQTTREEQTAKHDFNQELGWELAAVDGGVRVERINKNSPVAEAHLEENDLVISVAGENVLTADRIREILTKASEAGETKTDIVVRRDGQELSYLLSLDSVGPAGTTRTQTTARVTQTDLVQMIQQLQVESQQQQAMLQSLLMEVQNLRAQLGVAPGARVNTAAPGAVVPGGTQFTGDIVAPLGTVGGQNRPAGTATPPATGTATTPAPQGNQ